MTGPASPRLSVVTVNWNGGAEAVANVAQVAALARRRGDTEVVVVDNGSTDDSVAAFSALADGGHITLVRSERNLGFGPGTNLGVERARAPLVLLLNPDAAPRQDEDPLGSLMAAAASDPTRAGYAPLLEDAMTSTAPATAEAGRREPQHAFQFRRLPTLGSIAREMLLVDRLFPRSAAFRRSRYLDVDRTKPFAVEQPAAAALVLRRELFLRLGGFDPRYVPAWWEDVDLAARLAAEGETIVTVPTARFVHRGGSSIAAANDDGGDGRLAEREYRRIFGRNLLRYGEKWWGAPATILLRAILFVAGAMRWALAVAGMKGDRPRRVTIEAAMGTMESAFASIREGA